jgi:hypothetical protein
MLPMTRAQKLICNPQAYVEACSQRDKPKKDREPKKDGILAPTYLDAISIGKLAESQSYGCAPRGDGNDGTNEQRDKSS